MLNTKIALGTWAWGVGAFGGDSVFGLHTDAENLRPVFQAAADAGLSLWDTAAVYGMGESERLLGEFIAAEKRESVTVSTKFTPQLAEMYGNSVEKMAQASLKRLNIDYIDIYWIHNPLDVERWTPGLIPLLESGQVRSVGVSNHNLDEIRRADAILQKAGYRLSAVQNHFSLIYRSSEKAGILDYCRQNGLEFWAYMILEQGALTGRYSRSNPLPPDSDRGRRYNPLLDKLETLTAAMQKIGEQHGVSCPQIAIAYALAKGTVPIIGATKPHHVSEAAAAAGITLSTAEIDRLEELASAAGVDSRGDWEHAME